MPDPQDPRKPVQAIHKYLINNEVFDDVPEDYNEFEKAFRNPKIAQNIYGKMQGDKRIKDLPQDFDGFYYKIYPEEQKRTEQQLESAKQRGYDDVPLAEGKEDLKPPKPATDKPKDPAKGKPLAPEGTEPVDEQVTKAIAQLPEGEELSKPKIFKSMIRQKLSDAQKLLESDRFSDEAMSQYKPAEQGVKPTGVSGTGATYTYPENPLYREQQNLEEAIGIYEDVLNMPDADSDNNAMQNFWAGLKSAGVEEIPFVGSLIEIGKSFDKLDAFKRMESGEATAGDSSLIEATGLEQMARQDEDLAPPTGYDVGEGVVSMLPYMVEFGLTSGAYTAAKKATMTGIVSATKRYGSRKALEFLTTKAGKAGIRVGGEITGAMAQTFANPQAIIKNGVERMTPEYTMIMSADPTQLNEMEAGQGEDFGEAFSKGLGVTFSEFVTERFGQHFVGKIGPKKMQDFIKKISLSEWAKRKGFKTLGETSKAFKKAGWNGVFAETYLEEYPNGLANAFITGDRPLLEALNPASEEMKTTLYTMLVMGGVGQGGRLARGAKKVTQKAAGAVEDKFKPTYSINGQPIEDATLEESREAVRERIEAGDIGGLVINNDKELEAMLQDKAAAMRSAGEAVPAPKKNPAEQQLMEEIKGEEDAQMKQKGEEVVEEEENDPAAIETMINESEPGKTKRFQAGMYFGADADGAPVEISKQGKVWRISRQDEKGDWVEGETTATLAEANKIIAKSKQPAPKAEPKPEPKKETPPATEKKEDAPPMEDVGKEKVTDEEMDNVKVEKVGKRLFRTKNGTSAVIDYAKGTITRKQKGQPDKVHTYKGDALKEAIARYEKSNDFTEVGAKPKTTKAKPAPKKETKKEESTSGQDPLVIQEEADMARENIPATKSRIAELETALKNTKSPKMVEILTKKLQAEQEELSVYEKSLEAEKGLNKASKPKTSTTSKPATKASKAKAKPETKKDKPKTTSKKKPKAESKPRTTKKAPEEENTPAKGSTYTTKEIDQMGKAKRKSIEEENPEAVEKIKKSKGLILIGHKALAAARKLRTDSSQAAIKSYQIAQAAFANAAKAAGFDSIQSQRIVSDYVKSIYAREFYEREVSQEQAPTEEKKKELTEKEKKKIERQIKKIEREEKKRRREAEDELLFEQESTEGNSDMTVEDLEQEQTQDDIRSQGTTKRSRRPSVAPLKGKTKNAPLKSVASIMRGLARAARTPIRFTRALGKQTLGRYNTKFANILVRLEHDLGTAAHEIGHSLQDRHKLTKTASDEAMNEIMWLSEFGSKPPKGASEAQADRYRKGEALAEYIRAWLIDPYGTATAHPKFTDHFRKSVPKKTRDKLRESGDDIRRLYASTPQQLMVANTTLGDKEKKNFLSFLESEGGAQEYFKVSFWDRMHVMFLNDKHVFNKMTELAMKMHGIEPGEVLPANDPRIMLALTSGLHSKMDNILANGMVGYDLDRKLSDGRRMSYKWLMNMFDTGSNKGFEDDKEFTVAWMVAERTREILDRELTSLDDFTRDVVMGYVKENGIDDTEGMTKEEALLTMVKNQREVGAIAKKLKQKGLKKKERADLKIKLDELLEQEKEFLKGINAYHRKVVAGLGAGFYSDATEVDKFMAEVDKLKKEDPERYERLSEAKRRYREFADATLQYAVEGGRMAKQIRAGAVEGDQFESHGNLYEKVKGGWIVNGEKPVVRGADAKAITEEWLENHGELIGGYDYIKQNNNYYVAMNRIMDNQADADWGSAVKTLEVARGFGNPQAITYKLRGSAKPIIDPYESLLDNATRTIAETDNNAVRRAFVDLVVGEGIYKTTYSIGERQGIEEGEAVQGSLFENKGRKPIGEALVPYNSKMSGQNKLTIFRDGKHYEFHVPNGDLYAAFKRLTPASNWLARGLRGLKSIIQQSITLSPQFAVRNFMRDIQSRYILGVSTPATDFRGLKAPGENGWESAMDLYGGGQFGYYDRTSKKLYKNIEKDVKASLVEGINSGKIILAKTARGARKYKDFLAQSEKFNRAAEFKARFREGKRKGMDDYNAQLWAAYKSRGLIDFARGGVVAKQINQYVPFFNAGIQGVLAAVKTAKERPVEMAVRLAVMNMIPTLIEQALIDAAGDDTKKEYIQLPAYMKDMFYNIPWNGKFITIPKPFELGMLGSALARQYRYMNGDKYAFDGIGGSIAHSFFPPVSGSSQYFGGLKPFIELGYNRDSFRNRFIVSPRDQGLDLKFRNYERSSNVGKFVGENATAMLNTLGMELVVDPRQVDFLTKGLTTYAGSMALGSIDALTGRQNLGNSQYSNPYAITGIIKDTPVWGSRDVQRVLELGQKRPYTQEVSGSLMELLKAYGAMPEGETRDALKKTIFEVAKVQRNILESHYE
jgi:hypothetical protein